jgi:hypothetical protein
VRSGTILLDAKRRKRNRSLISKKLAGTETNSTPIDVEKAASTSNDGRKGSWSSLRKIAASVEHDGSEDH